MPDEKKSLIARRDFLRVAGRATAGGCLLPRDLAAALEGAFEPRGVLSSPLQGRPFEMLVLGDSIMWGQGLKEEQKFSYQVAEWLRAQLPGIEVHRHVFAHSGAQIRADPVEDAKPPKHGEVPSHFPSIIAQLETARTAVFPLHPPLDPRSVALVLLDGGINDFGSKVIINPDPTVGRAWVRRITRERCVDRMKALLPRVFRTFPNAKIVVTNYFQIVSERSDMAYLWELLRVWELVGGGINAMSEWLRTKMSDQSLAFHQESTNGFREAVADVSGHLAVGGKRAPVPGTVLEVGRLERTPSRVALAEVPFGPDNAYGGPDTYLFYVNEPDPAASVRKPICMAQVANASPELPNCLLAATGHPNTRGARAYARGITKVLERWVPDWQADFGVKAPKGPPVTGREALEMPRPRPLRP